VAIPKWEKKSGFLKELIINELKGKESIFILGRGLPFLVVLLAL
jgi:hypothetical protein